MLNQVCQRVEEEYLNVATRAVCATDGTCLPPTYWLHAGRDLPTKWLLLLWPTGLPG